MPNIQSQKTTRAGNFFYIEILQIDTIYENRFVWRHIISLERFNMQIVSGTDPNESFHVLKDFMVFFAYAEDLLNPHL